MENQNIKLTENNAVALSSTLNATLDLFALLGAMRKRSKQDVCELFEKAYAEDRLLALKMLFYTRNIRGGLGEREIFRTIANYLADNYSSDILVNFENIVKFGRFDDLYCFEGTKLEKQAFAFLNKVYKEDLKYINGKQLQKVSLLGKWLKSVNTSSKETCRLGKLTAKYFGETEKSYRKNLKALRKAINVVEAKMSRGEWTDIKYDSLPSLAALRYRGAFNKHDEEGYSAYLDSLKAGTSKVNASAVYPYEIARTYINCWDRVKEDTLIEEQWKALPNFVTDNKKFLIMADVSGSMTGTPMDVSVSLAIYFAQRNYGPFHNQFLTFSARPSLVTLSDTDSLAKNVETTKRADWGMNTDLKAAFELILNTAVAAGATQADLPDALVVITDMEIDSYGNGDVSFTTSMKEKFERAGYKMPVIVWWNVDARQNTFHAEYNDSNVRFISGCSAAIFKGLCEKMGSSPLELMLGVLNDPMYDCVKLGE